MKIVLHVVFLVKLHTYYNYEEKFRQIPIGRHSLKYLASTLKNIKVVKDKKSLGDYHSHEKLKST